jgi:hypothetical protein
MRRTALWRNSRSQATGSSCWLQVDGGDVHKAAVVRTIFGTSPSSTDHTKRVYGARKDGEARKGAAGRPVEPVDDTALTCVGDPVAAVVSVDRTAQTCRGGVGSAWPSCL